MFTRKHRRKFGKQTVKVVYANFHRISGYSNSLNRIKKVEGNHAWCEFFGVDYPLAVLLELGGVRAGPVRLPKQISKQFLLFVGDGSDLLGIIGIRGGLDCIERKHLRSSVRCIPR